MIKMIKRKKSKENTYSFPSTEIMGITLENRRILTLNENNGNSDCYPFYSFFHFVTLILSFVAIVITGFQLQVNYLILVPILFVFSFITYFTFNSKKLRRFKWIILFTLILSYGIIIFLTQDQLTHGFYRLMNGIVIAMNRKYESNLTIFTNSGNVLSLTIFILEVMMPIILWLSFAKSQKNEFLLNMIIFFPLLAVLYLAGIDPSLIAVFVFIISFILLIVSSRLKQKKKIWGEMESIQYKKNYHAFVSIKKTVLLIVLSATILISSVSFGLSKSVENVNIGFLENLTSKIEGKIVETLIDVLPAITAGKLNLRVDSVGGGVADGALGNVDGYAIKDIEDLKIIVTNKPTETIYLKGFVGSGYQDNHWLTPTEEGFINTSLTWPVDGDVRIYMQNLSFLRKLYTENETSQSDMETISVIRLNASSKYTYVPYYSYINNYYDVIGGDCYVSGQTLQDDIFSYYPREQYRLAIDNWNNNSDNESILDRLETSYYGFVKYTYTDVPEGFEELKEICDQQKIKSEDIEKVTKFIKEFFLDYTYSMDVKAVGNSVDFIYDFIFDSKEGYGPHFASAAVLMYRMFGIPARYVVGYAAPKNLFSMQADGNYSAVLQGDNAHAWVEVYEPEYGWMPVEMTPGAFGTAEDVEYIGDANNPQDNPNKQEEQEEQNNPLVNIINVLKYQIDFALLFSWITALFILFMLAFLVYKYRNDHGLNTKMSIQKRITYVFKTFYRKLLSQGMPKSYDSSQKEFYEWIKKSYLVSDEELTQLYQLIHENQYGFDTKTQQDLNFMRNFLKLKKKK